MGSDPTSLAGTGVVIAGVKYMFIRGDADCVIGKKVCRVRATPMFAAAPGVFLVLGQRLRSPFCERPQLARVGRAALHIASVPHHARVWCCAVP